MDKKKEYDLDFEKFVDRGRYIDILDQRSKKSQATRFFEVIDRASELYREELRLDPTSEKAKTTLWAIDQAIKEIP